MRPVRIIRDEHGCSAARPAEKCLTSMTMQRKTTMSDMDCPPLPPTRMRHKPANVGIEAAAEGSPATERSEP